MILLIDNYDSFTYNLFQYIAEDDRDIQVKYNDEITIEEIYNLNPDKIIISPGPSTPNDAGNCIEIVKEFYDKIPILGICLGHQVIGAAFGSPVVKADNILHGKIDEIRVMDHEDIFSGVNEVIDATRYHSLVIQKDALASCLKITSTSLRDNEIMSIKHKNHPVFGLQFHPESYMTRQGTDIISNFVKEDFKS